MEAHTNQTPQIPRGFRTLCTYLNNSQELLMKKTGPLTIPCRQLPSPPAWGLQTPILIDGIRVCSYCSPLPQLSFCSCFYFAKKLKVCWPLKNQVHLTLLPLNHIFEELERSTFQPLLQLIFKRVKYIMCLPLQRPRHHITVDNVLWDICWIFSSC